MQHLVLLLDLAFKQYGSFEQGGTAALSQLVGIDFAGKTGTAEGVNHGAGVKSRGAATSARTPGSWAWRPAAILTLPWLS
jgi:cell division protein FtsI/penicillin-binding protein 2